MHGQLVAPSLCSPRPFSMSIDGSAWSWPRNIQREALTPVLALIAMNATLVDAAPLTERVSADPDDDKFLAAAVAAHVNIVVSGDTDLLDVSGWHAIKVLTPRRFADRHLLAG